MAAKHNEVFSGYQPHQYRIKHKFWRCMHIHQRPQCTVFITSNSMSCKILEFLNSYHSSFNLSGSVTQTANDQLPNGDVCCL